MNNVKRGYRFAIALQVLALVITAVLPFVLPSSTPDAAYANSYTSSYTGTYYDGIDPTLTGSAMRSQLEKLITSTHKKLTTYDELKSIYGQTDIRPPANWCCSTRVRRSVRTAVTVQTANTFGLKTQAKLSPPAVRQVATPIIFARATNNSTALAAV